MKKNILIVEDNLKLNNGIRLALKGIADYGTNESGGMDYIIERGLFRSPHLFFIRFVLFLHLLRQFFLLLLQHAFVAISSLF